jgi:hypothetical protein
MRHQSDRPRNRPVVDKMLHPLRDFRGRLSRKNKEKKTNSSHE